MGADLLIDQIYEASLIPELWTNVLDQLGSLSHSDAGAVFCFRPKQPPRYLCTDRMQLPISKFIDHPPHASARLEMVFKHQSTEFRSVAGVLENEAIASDPVTAILRNAGLGDEVFATVPLPDGEVATFAHQRRAGLGAHSSQDIDALNVLLPHLSRAALISARLNLASARSSAATLQALGMPAAVVTQYGNVLAANDLFEDLRDVFRPVAFGRIALVQPEADQMLQMVFEPSTNAERDGITIPIKGTTSRPAIILHVVPVRRSGCDVFCGASYILIATQAELKAKKVPHMVLRGLFDLAPKEAVIASELLRPSTVDQLARDNQMTEKSFRTYIERINTKTGTRGLKELRLLLAQIAFDGPA